MAKAPYPAQKLIKIIQPAPTVSVSAKINSYSPSSKIEVDSGQSFTLGVTFTNTCDTAWDFLAGASVWNSNGKLIINEWSSTIRVQPGQNGNYSWTKSINTPSEYWLQFGVWKDKSTLLDKSPSSSQNLIKVGSAPISVSEPTPTLAEIIEQESTDRVPVTVDGQQYFIVTLKSYIDPETLKCSSASHPIKAYVDNEGNPVPNPEIARKIDVVDQARRWMEGVGSATGISKELDNIERTREAHELLVGWKFASDILTKAVAMYITTGKSIAAEAVSGALSTAVSLATDPARAREWIAYENFSNAEDEYEAALQIVESGLCSDSDVAHDYLTHLFTAYAYHYPAVRLLLPAEELDKSWLDDIQNMGNSLAQELVPGGSLLKPFQNFVGHVEQLPSVLQFKEDRQSLLSSYKAALSQLNQLNYNARYTVALALGSPKLMGEAGAEIYYLTAATHSPVELRVYSSKGKVTGVVDGEMRIEISGSVCYGNAVKILWPTDSYTYEVVGTSEGSYDVTLTRVTEQESSAFAIADVPTLVNTVHQYTIDWETLSQGGQGVTIQTDSDSDGVFEQVLKLSVADTESEGESPSWLWISLCVGIAFILSFAIAIGWYMARRRITNRSALK